MDAINQRRKDRADAFSEMLEALKDAEHFIANVVEAESNKHGRTIDSITLNTIRAAIAKAEGK